MRTPFAVRPSQSAEQRREAVDHEENAGPRGFEGARRLFGVLLVSLGIWVVIAVALRALLGGH